MQVHKLTRKSRQSRHMTAWLQQKKQIEYPAVLHAGQGIDGSHQRPAGELSQTLWSVFMRKPCLNTPVPPDSCYNPGTCERLQVRKGLQTGRLTTSLTASHTAPACCDPIGYRWRKAYSQGA
eukprot:1156580-Pelagomonas_calceolata.AAC.8